MTVSQRALKKQKFDSTEQETYLALWRTYDRLKAIEDEFFSDWDLTAQQYNLMRLLSAKYPEAVPTLSLTTRLVSRAPDMTRMIDKLETHGWILRERSTTDRRTVLVVITETGLKKLDEMAEPLKSYHERQLGHLNAAEQKTLTELLRKARAPHEPDDSIWT